MAFPGFFNNPVPGFGSLDARLLIVGLAPGLKGANKSGRPFTGDYAGELLYSALHRQGLARGVYRARADDGLQLSGVRISNAVRCVPPENKPLPVEINSCRPFLSAEIEAMANLRAILTLGQIAHQTATIALSLKRSHHAFTHGAEFQISHAGRPIHLIASYHCSRYNTNTGVLTEEMFETVLAAAKKSAGL